MFPRFLAVFLSLALAVGLVPTTPSVRPEPVPAGGGSASGGEGRTIGHALRVQAGLESDAEPNLKAALREESAAGLENPPFGRWIRTQQDGEQAEAIVRTYKGRRYPRARKKGTREHGTKKTLIALKREGFYVRFYQRGNQDYFVFPRESGTSSLIVKVEGQRVEIADGLPLEADDVDYPQVERVLGKRLWSIYAVGHPYHRLRILGEWLRSSLPVPAAVALAKAKDFMAAKEAYDSFIKAGLSRVAAYRLASTPYPNEAFARYQQLIAEGMSGSYAYHLKAVASPRAQEAQSEPGAQETRPAAGLEEEQPRGTEADAQRQIAAIAQRLGSRLSEDPRLLDLRLLGVGPQGLREHGRELALFLSGLKSQTQALNLVVLLVGEEASSYERGSDTLLGAESAEAAAGVLRAWKTGRLEYFATEEEARQLTTALTEWETDLLVGRQPVEDLPLILRRILGILAGIDLEEVDSFTEGINLSELAATLKELARLGV